MSDRLRQLEEQNALLLRALARAVTNPLEKDKWHEHGERVVALVTGSETEYNRRDLYRQMDRIVQSWGADEPTLPIAPAMTAREMRDLKERDRS